MTDESTEAIKSKVCVDTISTIYDGLVQGCTSGRITEKLREASVADVRQSDTQPAGLLAIVNRDQELLEIAAAAKKLALMAMTTGGTAGRDQSLCNAIKDVTDKLEALEQNDEWARGFLDWDGDDEKPNDS